MYSPVHATTGFFIALTVPNPWAGIPLAIASHYVLDAIPHGDTGLGPWMTAGGFRHRLIIVETIDLGSAALMVSWLAATHAAPALWYALAGAVGGILPDLLWGSGYLLGKLARPIPFLTPFLHWHNRVHSWGHAKPKYDLPFRIGVFFQGLILALVLLLRL